MDRVRADLQLSIAVLFAFVGPMLGGGHVFARIFPWKPLNPKAYTSPSGVYALFVNPSDRDGRYHATYRLDRGQDEVWSATLPFTLWEAGVTDEGVVAGYAYTHGVEGIGERDSENRYGDFHTVILDPAGKPRLNEITLREFSMRHHAPPVPIAEALIVDGPNDRMVLRVEDNPQGGESWRVYRLSTGDSLARWDRKQGMPDPGPARFVITAKPVAGTPLILMHWWRFAPEGVGARFTLVGPEGKTVWSFDLPEDYTIPDDEDAQDRLMHRIRRSGAILRTDEPGRFELHFVADAQRVTFRATSDVAGRWAVNEVAREKYVEPSPPPVKPVAIPERPLKALDPLELQVERHDASPIRDCSDFVFDGKGRLAFVRDEANKPDSLVVVEPTGRVLHEISLEAIAVEEGTDWSGFAWAGGDRYVITRSPYGWGGLAKAWWIEPRIGRVAPVEGFESPSVKAIAGSPLGGFVVLATGYQRYSPKDTVRAYDADGQVLWMIRQDYNGGPEALFSPEAIAIASDGTLAVLDNIQNTIQLFNRNGKYQKTLHLHSLWNREPNYPSEIAADVDRGFLVYDFGGKPPNVRMKSDGSVVGGFEPRHADGRVVDTLNGVKADPEGRLWTCDGYALYRLTDAGVVDRVVGDAPNPDRLGKPAGLAVDGAGRCYVVDRRTGAVHVFDRDGRRQHVCRPKPTDFTGSLSDPVINLTEDGHVLLGRTRRVDYVRFSPSGTRLGVERLPIEVSHRRWQFQPGTRNRWVIDSEEVYLVTPSGDVPKTILRGPDGNWLEDADQASVAPDGSLALIARSSPSDREDSQLRVHLFTAEGDPVRSFALPSLLGYYPEIAYGAKHLVVTGQGNVVVFDHSGKLLQRFEPPGQLKGVASRHPYLVSNGRELLLWNEDHRIHRYEMP